MSTQIGITHREERAVRAIEGGSMTEAVGGAAAIVLAILGLIGVLPEVMASIATIAVGVALLTIGGVIAARYARAIGPAESPTIRREITGGMGMEALAGVATVVLGILALLRIAPITLLAVATIVLGAAMLMASGAMARLESLARTEPLGAEHPKTHDVVYAATGSEVLVGVGAVVLGILALSGHAPLTLVLVALLSIGASVLVSGSALAARFFESFG
jgi:hypothetical protein